MLIHCEPRLPTPSCALRPDRLNAWAVTGREPLCAKRRLEALLGRQFDRLCVAPQALNKCFDWDTSGDRWARGGFTCAAAYKELGLKPSAKMSQLKAAKKKFALDNHPDKLVGASAARQSEAQHAFMKATLAYNTIMNAKRCAPPKAG